MKNSLRKRIKNRLDKLWSLIIRILGKCEICDNSGCKLDAHHIEGKGTLLLRYNLDNGIALCFNCHRNGVHSPASSVQASFRKKIMEIRGQDKMEELARLRYVTIKLTDTQLLEIEKKFKIILDN